MLQRFRWRSAVTGRFVKRLFALLNPFTTVRERRWDIHETYRDTMRRYPETMRMVGDD